MMTVITGDKYNVTNGMMVICDPESIRGVRIKIGDTVSFEGGKYVVDGIIPPPAGSDKWSVRLV